MALPSSGQISILDIVNEGTGGGCYVAELGGYSLGSLATAFGIPGDPDAMSEFYGLSCPFTAATIYFSEYFDGSIPQGYQESRVACTAGIGGKDPSTTVYYSGTFGVGTLLYEDSGLTVGFNNNSGWFCINPYAFLLKGNIVAVQVECFI